MSCESSMKKQSSYSPWLHRVAWFTAGATFLLIVIGGIVTSTESGLAVPDWPTSFGYNMFTYPLSEMVKNPKILYEHSHRLMGSLVGLLTITLFVMLLVKDSRGWAKWLGFAALIGVSVQGVLGGLRVTEVNLNFAIVHACLAQAFFALLCGICWFTSRDWIENQNLSESIVDNVSAKKLRRLSLITTCLIYVQLIFGAILRHTGSRLDAHLLFAFLVTLHIFLLVRRFFNMSDNTQKIGQSLPLLLLGLLAVQLILGFGAYITKLTAVGATASALLTDIVTTAHVAVGALMLVSSFVITLKIYRFTNTTIPIETPVTSSLVTE
ncbi:cytochrome oxidase assembly protein [Candidatus Poribacteria bacterium]|nr:MAG: cytochrome oxidase assembly protein [Candidatus Poribacteria bacterium]